MKIWSKRIKAVVIAMAVIGSLGFGAAQAFGVDPESGCPFKVGCRYGGYPGSTLCCNVP